MKFDLTISDISIEDNILISKFIKLLSMKGMKMSTTDGSLFEVYPGANDKIRRIEEILGELDG